MSDRTEAEKVILLLECRDCGTELNRTVPVTKGQAAKARISSGLAAPSCPNGCRPTFSDCNWNTTLREIPA